MQYSRRPPRAVVNTVSREAAGILPFPAREDAEDRKLDEHRPGQDLTEQQIDKTLADSFPASDPPGW